jgi:hypothetical protein
MKLIALAALALVLAAPSLAQEAVEAAPSPAPVSYDDAVTCALLATVLVLRDDSSEELKNSAGPLIERFIGYAQRVGEKSQDEVIDAMGAAGPAMFAQLQASSTPVSDMHARFATCQADAERL